MLLSKIFTTLFQQILNSRLLNVVIDRQKNNFNDGFYCECSTSKKKNFKKKEQYTKIYIYIFHNNFHNN